MKSIRRSLLIFLGIFMALSTQAAPPKERAKPTSKPAPRTVTHEDLLAAIEELKALVTDQSKEIAAQRQRISALESDLHRADAANPAESSAMAAPLPPQDLADQVADLHTEVAAAKKEIAETSAHLGNFRFSGDIRTRSESFFQNGGVDRTRWRVRARLNLLGNINDELYGGLTFSSGSLDDPVSTNQTLGSTNGFFNRKTVGFDRFFLQYKPKWAGNHLTTLSGKFAFPWIRTPMTFDVDINPEGLAQQLSFDSKSKYFKNFTVVGFQLILSEVPGVRSATTGLITTPGFDSWIFGGQLQTRWELSPRVKLGSHLSGINFINSDRIAQALTTDLNGVGAGSRTNTLRTNANGQVIGYASRFLYLDWVTQLDIETPWEKWPVAATFNFVNNMRATNIVQNGTANPTAQIHNPERSGYWSELLFGRQQHARDWQLGYQLFRIERDAVVGSFVESDVRASTNLLQHKFVVTYQWMKNVQLFGALWVGRLANAQDSLSLVPAGERLPGSACGTAPFTGCRESYLKRFQLDLIYKF